GMAEVGARIDVGGAAALANVERRRREFAVLPLVAALEDDPSHAMAAAFVVDEAVRTEFADADEPCPLDGRAARRSAASRGNECDQRQAREVVARQEPFGGEVAVGVEIRLLVLAAAAQQVHLLLGVAT